MKKKAKYSLSLRCLHWLMAFALLGMIASGWYMTGLKKEVSYKFTIYYWHKSFGVLLLSLFFLRLIARLRSPIPQSPRGWHGYERVLAHLTHTGLYLFMLLVPLSGYLMTAASPGRKVPFFGLNLPDIISKNKGLAQLMHEIHHLAPYILLGLIAVHVLAIIKHRFIDRPGNNVLNRML